MTINELRDVIEKEGLRTGYDLSTDNLIILSKGHLKIGQVNYRKPFDVQLNLHFSRQLLSDESKQIIFDAVFDFVSTPIEERIEKEELKWNAIIFVILNTTKDMILISAENTMSGKKINVKIRSVFFASIDLKIHQ